MRYFDEMIKILFQATVFLALLSPICAQTVPNELRGKWVIRREVPTTTIACWGEEDAKKLIGTEIEYSVDLFRWAKVITKNPAVKITTVTAEQFHDENSGGTSSGSQVTFQQLGIKADKALQIVIQHPAGNVTEATSEIPGDSVIVKNKNTIIFSVCGVYFEARRAALKPAALHSNLQRE